MAGTASERKKTNDKKKTRHRMTFEDAVGRVVDARDISLYMRASVNTRNMFFDLAISVATWIGLVVVLVWAPGFADSRYTFRLLDEQTLWHPHFSFSGNHYQLADVKSPDMMWAWVQQVVLPQTFGAISSDLGFSSGNCSSTDSALLHDATTGSFWLWGLRFRQIRATATECQCSANLTSLLGGTPCAGAKTCSGTLSTLEAQETQPFPSSPVLSTAVLDEDLDFASSYTWRSLHSDTLASSGSSVASYVVDLYYCDGEKYAETVVEEMANSFLSDQTRRFTVELYRLHTGRQLVQRLAIHFEQSPLQDWDIITTPQTTSDVIFLSGVPLAAAASNIITVAVLVTLAMKLYFLNYSWAIVHGVHWRWMLLDGVLLGFWLAHGLGFAINWALYDISGFVSDVEYNQMSSSYSSGDFYVTALPPVVESVFNTLWVALATIRLCALLVLDSLSFTISLAVCERSCCQFQAGILIYAAVLSGFLCLVSVILFPDAWEFFKDFGRAVGTFVGYGLYVFRTESIDGPGFERSVDVNIVLYLGKFVIATVVGVTYTALFVNITQRASKELSDREADAFGLVRKRLPPGFLDQAVNLKLGRQALAREVRKWLRCGRLPPRGTTDDLRHFSYVKMFEFFSEYASSGAANKLRIRGLARVLRANLPLVLPKHSVNALGMRTEEQKLRQQRRIYADRISKQDASEPIFMDPSDDATAGATAGSSTANHVGSSKLSSLDGDSDDSKLFDAIALDLALVIFHVCRDVLILQAGAAELQSAVSVEQIEFAPLYRHKVQRLSYSITAMHRRMATQAKLFGRRVVGAIEQQRANARKVDQLTRQVDTMRQNLRHSGSNTTSGNARGAHHSGNVGSGEAGN